MCRPPCERPATSSNPVRAIRSNTGPLPTLWSRPKSMGTHRRRRCARHVQTEPASRPLADPKAVETVLPLVAGGCLRVDSAECPQPLVLPPLSLQRQVYGAMLPTSCAEGIPGLDPLLSFVSTSWVSAMAAKAAGASGWYRRAPKLPHDRPGSVTFRICEAAVRGLRRPASGRNRSR